jgi:penicillin-binding protein 1B
MTKQASKKQSTFKRIIFRLAIVLLVFLIGLVIYSDAEIQQKFAVNRWLVPAKIYARPMTFVQGQPLKLSQLEQELKLLNYRKTIKVNRPGEYERYENDFIVYVRGFQFADGFVGARKLSLSITDGVLTKVKLLDQAESYTSLRLEPLLIGRANPLVSEDRELVSLKKVPPYLIDALLVSEDRDFFDHWGISVRGVLRALGQNLSEGKVTQGGSTITQQLVKNYFLSNERSLWRKTREAVMALTLEWRYQKEEILEAYINEVYLGQQGGKAIHGFGRASRFYFDRDISELSLSQAATLVALVRGPSYYDPRRHPDRALERRNLILDQLLEHDRITANQWENARQKSLQVIPSAKAGKSKMPAVMGMVRYQLKQHYSMEQLNHQDLSVFTSIDPQVQRQAELALEQRINGLVKSLPKSASQLQGAIIVSDRYNGDILAVVGDKDPDYDGFNRAIHAYRQTGSAIKPFIYLSALERASRFNWVTELDDRAFSLTATDGTVWTPQNYDKTEHGKVPLNQALVHSYNLSTARLAMQLGIDTLVDSLYQYGFERELKAFPSLALGAQEMSPLELLKLYQVLATGGMKVESSVVKAVITAEGQLLDRYPATAKQVVSAESVYLVNRMLQQVVQVGTAKSAPATIKKLRMAGKTGTTDDLKDSWFAGFGDGYLAVVWLGLDNNQPTGLTGASGALRVWSDFMLQMESSPLALQPPSGIVFAKTGWFGDCVPFVAGYVPEDYSECD